MRWPKACTTPVSVLGGEMTTPTIDGAAESLKLELAKYFFLDKTYMFGKFSFSILNKKNYFQPGC